MKAALQQLEVVVRPRHSAKYVCGECLRLLQRIQSARQKLNVLEDQASNLYRKGANRCGIGIKARTSKRSLFAPSTEEEDLGQENAAVGALPHLSPVNGGPVVLLESSEQVTEVPSFLLSPKAVTAHGKELSFQVTSTPAAPTPPSCRDEITKSVAGQATAVKVMKSIAETAVEKKLCG